MSKHIFGGPWTEIKLDAVEYYLGCYTRALKQVDFDLWYIDAFAGSGDRENEREVGGIFEGTPIELVRETLAGSARRALGVTPSFDHFVFIEKDDDRYAALQDIRTASPTRDIRIIQGEANDELAKLVASHPWSRKNSSKSRGVVFLDPYALHVDWRTLQALASTQVLDVWYLFPIRDTICRGFRQDLGASRALRSRNNFPVQTERPPLLRVRLAYLSWPIISSRAAIRIA
jgi:three-Cys-motif partner protein